MPKGEYGFTQQEHDHAMLWRAARGSGKLRIIWGGKDCVVNSSGTVKSYLKRIGTAKPSQCLYVPEEIIISAAYFVVALGDVPDYWGEFIGEAQTDIYRASGGNVTVDNTAVFTFDTDVTITPTANTTVQGVEMVVAEASGDSTNSFIVYMDCLVMDISTEGKSILPTPATSALSAVETI